MVDFVNSACTIRAVHEEFFGAREIQAEGTTLSKCRFLETRMDVAVSSVLAILVPLARKFSCSLGRLNPKEVARLCSLALSTECLRALQESTQTYCHICIRLGRHKVDLPFTWCRELSSELFGLSSISTPEKSDEDIETEEKRDAKLSPGSKGQTNNAISSLEVDAELVVMFEGPLRLRLRQPLSSIPLRGEQRQNGSITTRQYSASSSSMSLLQAADKANKALSTNFKKRMLEGLEELKQRLGHASQSDDKLEVLMLLSRLEVRQMSIELMSDSSIVPYIKSLREAADTQISTQAKLLVKHWKAQARKELARKKTVSILVRHISRFTSSLCSANNSILAGGARPAD